MARAMPELQKNLVSMFDSLKQAGVGMGLSAGGRTRWRAKVLHIPPKANINTWMSDEAKRMAQEPRAPLWTR
jgi:hypothetical protein